MKNLIILVCLNFILPLTCHAAATVDSLMPEFAGRGNLMGGAEVCNLTERHAFKKQSMRLIKESGLNAKGQAKLIQSFNTEYKEGLTTYKMASPDVEKPNCENIKEQIQLLPEEGIEVWKSINLN